MPEHPGLILNPTNLSNLEAAAHLVGSRLSRTLPDGSTVTVTLGDVSGDGYIEDDDLDFLRTLLSDTEQGALLRSRISAQDLAACDLDGDGVVDVRDLLVLTTRILTDFRKLALTDELTGLDNRRAFKEKARMKVNTARRYGIPMACIAVDLDHFKEINDAYGHAAGDQALQRVADLLREETRDSDLLCRYGGDEFLVLLDHMKPDQVVPVAERLLEAAQALRARSPDGREFPVPLSLGVALYRPDLDLQGLMHQADLALYRAKRKGRGRAELAPNPEPG